MNGMIALYRAWRTAPEQRTLTQKKLIVEWCSLFTLLLLMAAGLCFDPSGNAPAFLLMITVIWAACRLSMIGWRSDDEIKYPTCPDCGGLRLCKGHHTPPSWRTNMVPRYPGDIWSPDGPELSAGDEIPAANPTTESSGTRHQGSD